MPMPNEAASPRPVTLGCFEVAGRVYGFDVARLREVVRWQPATPLPGAPPVIDGVVDLRGAVIPIVDLGRILAGAPIDVTPRARIAIAEIGDRIVGLAVEAAIDVISVEGSELSDPPDVAAGTRSGLTASVVRRPDAEPIVVLSLERLLEQIPGPGAPPAEASP
jgi:purine-binding chemotaxis protein CheW